MKGSFLATVVALVQFTAADYAWPSPYDELEDLLSLQSGYIRRGFIDG
jgi:hypothetical protein